jgi:hypothetical protein
VTFKEKTLLKISIWESCQSTRKKLNGQQFDDVVDKNCLKKKKTPQCPPESAINACASLFSVKKSGTILDTGESTAIFLSLCTGNNMSLIVFICGINFFTV